MSRRGIREARRYLLGSLLLELGLRLGGLRPRGRALVGSATAILLFFRDPGRELDPDENLVYAAADGRVVKVDRVEDPWIREGEAARVSTFLSLHNVHVTRSPVAGEITAEEDLGDGFRPAFLTRAEENRRRRLAIDGRSGRVVVVQAAGMVARRIAAWVSVGDRLVPGQRLGLIHFGSRTDVLLPAGSVEVLVRPGERMRAGQTPLARYRQPEPAGGVLGASGAAPEVEAVP
jgi:phosphatidylserine decarboxylase